MTGKPVRVLFVEDNPDDVELVLRMLRKEGYDPSYRRVETDPELRLALLQEPWDLVLCDWSMPSFAAPEALEVVKASHRDVPFVIISGTVGEETAVEAMRSGADDFLLKERLTRLGPIVERELSESVMRRERQRVASELHSRETILATLGEVAECLVRAEAIDQGIREVLARIGSATNAARVFLYRHHRSDPEGPMLASLAHEWVAGGCVPSMGDPTFQDMAWEEVGLADAVGALERGVSVQLRARDLSEELRDLVHDLDMRSFIMAPVSFNGVWWGTMGLGDADEERHWAEGEVSALRTVANTIGAAVERSNLIDQIRRSHSELLEAYDRTLEGWSRALELRDQETEGHSRRVTDLTIRIARQMGIEGDELANVRRGALLHDIGKMGIPDTILLKRGSLTDEEWQVMRLHPLFAHDLLAAIPYLAPALHIPYCHHERWDGTGYPRGLQGEEIPLASRIFSVADVWDAMRSDRPYRSAMTAEMALAIIEEGAGKEFDPAVVQAFRQVMGTSPRSDSHPASGDTSRSSRSAVNPFLRTGPRRGRS